MLIFEWDAEKARENEQKHDISFLEASEVFDDDHSSAAQDPDHSADEERSLIFGMSKQGKYLVASYTERGDRIRMISARQMTSRERSAYEA
ncbi:MAG: BrnT family toxin [Burkholderiales bacterium]